MDSKTIDIDKANLIFSKSLQNGSEMHNNELLEKFNKEIFITMLPAIVYTSVMILFGLPGNIIVFYIYFVKWRRSTSRIFILFLAALDTMNCFTNLPMEIYIMWSALKLDKPVLCKLSRYSTYVMNCSSALILIGIAADRFKRICRPYQKPFSETQSMYISVAAVLWSLATTWPSLIFYGTRTVNLGNATGSACLLKNSYDISPYPIVYFTFMVTTTMITFLILTFLYYLVGLQIYKHRKFKLQNCTHVQEIVDDKSVTSKSEKSNGEKLKSSISNAKSAKEESCTNHNPFIMVVKDESVTPDDEEKNEEKLKPYQLGLPSQCKDDGTSCGLLDIPYKQRDEHHGSDLDVSDVSKETVEHFINDIKVSEVLEQTPERTTKMLKDKKKRRRVRYLLVRGSSTMNAAGQTSCINCLTVKVGRSTFMLFLITIAYVISFLPFYILVIVRQLDSNFVPGMSKSGLAFYHLFIRSYLLSSAVNPFIYSFCNVQFREYCKEIFMEFCLKRKQSKIK